MGAALDNWACSFIGVTNEDLRYSEVGQRDHAQIRRFRRRICFTSAIASPGWIRSEEDRTYNLLCYARQAPRTNSMPEDLIIDVLYERHYAFSWLGSNENWDALDIDT